MNLKQVLVIGAVWAFAVNASQAVYKNIVVDGDFSDWADVPVAATDEAGDNDVGPDLAMLKIANDETNLYLYIAYYAEVNPNAGPSVYLGFDTDQNKETGFDVFGLGVIGSEVGWVNDYPFKQNNGVFNDGSILDGAAAIAPFNTMTFEQEYAIPLSATYTDSEPVFSGKSFDLMVYTDPTGTNEHMDVVSYTLAKHVEEAEFGKITLTSVVAMQVTNSQEGVLYSLEYNAAFPEETNWVSSGFTVEGNGEGVYLYDPAGYSTAKVYRVMSWQK